MSDLHPNGVNSYAEHELCRGPVKAFKEFPDVLRAISHYASHLKVGELAALAQGSLSCLADSKDLPNLFRFQ